MRSSNWPNTRMSRPPGTLMSSSSLPSAQPPTMLSQYCCETMLTFIASRPVTLETATRSPLLRMLERVVAIMIGLFA